jgi:hypothetical protein
VAAPGGAAASTATGSPLATGPVGRVPGPQPGVPPAPSTGTAVLPTALPVTTAGAGPRRDPVVDRTDEPQATGSHRGAARAGVLLLGALAAVALESGLLVDGGTPGLWARVPLWSAFATAAGSAALAGVAARLAGRHRAAATRVAAAGLGGLAVFWLLVALPTADTDRGFLLTAGLAGLAAAVRAAGRGGAGGAAPEG